MDGCFTLRRKPPPLRQWERLENRGKQVHPRPMLTVAALYHFTRFDDPAALRPPLLASQSH